MLCAMSCALCASCLLTLFLPHKRCLLMPCHTYLLIFYTLPYPRCLLGQLFSRLFVFRSFSDSREFKVNKSVLSELSPPYLSVSYPQGGTVFIFFNDFSFWNFSNFLFLMRFSQLPKTNKFFWRGKVWFKNVCCFFLVISIFVCALDSCELYCTV